MTWRERPEDVWKMRREYAVVAAGSFGAVACYALAAWLLWGWK